MIRFRSAPVRAAAWFAAAFVVLRILYQGAFAGLDRGGRVLLDLPSVRLPDPVDHVVLLGPVTATGLAEAVRSTLPVVAVVLALGLLNAVLDVPALCARASRGGPLRGAAQALVIAWATFPALVRSVGDVRRARRLRGERGAAALLVPVMERTVERAVALGASMQVRGFAADRVERSRAADAERVTPGAPALLDDARLGFGGPWSLRADLSLRSGSLTLLTGATGSGKTTLLRALVGLHQHADGGEVAGTMEVAGLPRTLEPHVTAPLVGLVPQLPRLGFVAETVREEIGFASRVQGADEAETVRRVERTAASLGVTDLLERSTAHLSAGQSHLVTLAAAVAHEPVLVLADEPLADLDPDAAARVARALVALARGGASVLVAEHRTALLAEVADRRLAVTGDEDGVGVAVVEVRVDPSGDDDTPRAAGADGTGAEQRTSAARERRATTILARTGRDPLAEDGALRVRDVVVAREGRPVLRGACLDVAPGELVVVTGEIGSGKTTLLEAVALPGPHDVTIGGRPLPRGRGRLRDVTLVPDASDDLLFRTTVAAECRRADRRSGLPVGTTLTRWKALLPEGGDVLTERHPRDLSAGQRRLLVIALQLAPAPSVLMVDEPSRGLDPVASTGVRVALRSLADQGTAVLVASHDPALQPVADRVLTLRGGLVHEVAEVAR